jgi:glycosyltransferase involved in cell wall biosynthesis
VSEPLFTVVLATRDRAAMLRTAIKSLLWQTCGDFECVVIDDGSTDATPDVFKEFSGDARFVWRRREEGRGLAAARNLAMPLARGKWVTFLDDDDIWLPERLAVFRDAARERPSVGFWLSNAYLWRYDHVIGRLFDPARAVPEGKLPGWYAIGDRFLPYVTTNLSILRSAFEKVGVFAERIPILADTDMCVRLLDSGCEVGSIPQPLSVRRLHDLQITQDHARAFEESAVVWKNAKVADELRASLRRDLALEIAGYMIKSRKGRKVQDFLRRTGIERDGRYWRLYAAGFLPVPLVAGLYAARKAYLRVRWSRTLAGPEFRAVDELVRPIL